MNNLTAKRVIKRQYNTIIDEEAKIRRCLEMETDDSLPSQLSVGLLVKVEQHLDRIIEAQSRIVLLQQIVNPEQIMAKKEKWDGKSRPSNKAYDEGYKRIFGEKKPEVTSNIDTFTKSMQLTTKGRNVQKKKKVCCK